MNSNFKTIFTKHLRQAIAAFGAVLGLASGAQAGLVTGNWDPEFGPYLPGLSWQVRGEFQVPNGCSLLADGIYSTTSGACAGASVQNVWLRMFDTGLADPNNFFGVTPNSTYWILGPSYTGLSQIRVEAGSVVGAQTPGNAFAESAYTFFGNPTVFSAPPSAEGNLFSLRLDVNGPILTCLNCRANLADEINYGAPDVVASTSGLTQFLVTYTTTSTATPKFSDGDGNALGARLDSAGNYIGQSTSTSGPVVSAVPEPGALALALTAFFGAALATRRRRAG